MEYTSNYLSESEEQELLKFIEELDFKPIFSGRCVVQYGYEYLYNSQNIKQIEPIPERLKLIDADQLIINKYEIGQGISAHIDSLTFGPEIKVISIGGGVELVLKKGIDIIKKYIEPRSMYILKDEFRYEYTHEIPRRKTDKVNGKRVYRTTRYSLTYRTL